MSIDTLKQTVKSGYNTLADNITVDSTDVNSMFTATAVLKLNNDMFVPYSDKKIGEVFTSIIPNLHRGRDDILYLGAGAILDTATYGIAKDVISQGDVYGYDNALNYSNGYVNNTAYNSVFETKGGLTVVNMDGAGGFFPEIFEKTNGAAVRWKGYSILLYGGMSEIIESTYNYYYNTPVLTILDANGRVITQTSNMQYCGGDTTHYPVHAVKASDDNLYIFALTSFTSMIIYKFTTSPLVYVQKSNEINGGLLESSYPLSRYKSRIIVMSDDSCWYITKISNEATTGYIEDIKAANLSVTSNKTIYTSDAWQSVNTAVPFMAKKGTRAINIASDNTTRGVSIASKGTLGSITPSSTLENYNNGYWLSPVFMHGSSYAKIVKDNSGNIKTLIWDGSSLNLTVNSTSGLDGTPGAGFNVNSYGLDHATNPAASSGSIIAIIENGILKKSTDNGSTFTSVTTPIAMPLSNISIHYVLGNFYFVGATEIWKSTDLTSFTKLTIDTSNAAIHTLRFSNDKLNERRLSEVSPFQVTGWTLDANHILMSIRLTGNNSYTGSNSQYISRAFANLVINTSTNTARLISTASDYESGQFVGSIPVKLDNGNFAFVYGYIKNGTHVLLDSNKPSTVLTPAQLISGEASHFTTGQIANITATNQYTQYVYAKIK